MRYLYSLSFFFFTSLVLANTQHITPLVGLNTDQESGAGYGFSYNYELFEGIDIEAIYLNSKTLSAAVSEVELTGKYESLLIGVNAIKPYNNDLHFKLGGGIGYIFNSDNETLVADKKMSPYLKFTFNYRISDNTAIEFGQITQKIDGELSASHTFFAGFNWKFGSSSTINNQYSSPTPTAQQEVSTPLVVADDVNNISPEPKPILVEETNILPVIPTPWYLQLGAFNKASNAKISLAKYQQALPQLKLTLHESPPLYRIISYGLADKKSAQILQDKIKSNFAVTSYIVYLPATHN